MQILARCISLMTSEASVPQSQELLHQATAAADRVDRAISSVQTENHLSLLDADGNMSSAKSSNLNRSHKKSSRIDVAASAAAGMMMGAVLPWIGQA